MIIDTTQTKIERNRDYSLKIRYYQLLMHLHKKGVIDGRTLCEAMDIDYQEVKRLREESKMLWMPKI